MTGYFVTSLILEDYLFNYCYNQLFISDSVFNEILPIEIFSAREIILKDTDIRKRMKDGILCI